VVSDPDTLGAELAAARNRRELTLDQVERQTRIRAHYLAALEDHDYALLPSAVQGRGFLRNYARFLGLDVEECERRFNATLYASARRGRTPTIFADDPTLLTVSQRTPTSRSSKVLTPSASNKAGERPSSVRSSRNPTTAPPVNPPNGNRTEQRGDARRSRTRNMTLGTLAIVGFSLIALALILLYINHGFGITTPVSPILSPLPNTDTPVPTATATITPTADRPTPLPNPAATGAAAVTGGLALQITERERAPLRITIDDQVVYSGVPAANTVLKYQAKTSIQIHTGDAGAIDIVINGVLQPPIGEAHAIADKTFTLTTISTNAATNTQGSPVSVPAATTNAIVPPTATLFVGSKP
jgi:hypothetical protein